jgi:hypothetical protein
MIPQDKGTVNRGSIKIYMFIPKICFTKRTQTQLNRIIEIINVFPE